MQLKIKSLKLNNFKGIRNKEVLFKTLNTSIKGANATGKTTIQDAYTFLLTGKDSKGATGFEVQTLDESNNKLHKLDHEVTGIFELNGTTYTISRLVNEKWVKPKGQKEEVLDDKLNYIYSIDGIPMLKRDFDKFLSEKFMLELIELISNPLTFCSLPWQQQREKLYEICGVASDDEVIDTDPRFAFLRKVFEDKDAETFKKSLAAQIKKLKEEILKLDTNLKYANEHLIDEHNRQEVIREKQRKEIQITELNKQLESSQEQFESLRVTQKQILDLEQSKVKIISSARDDAMKGHSENKLLLNKKEYELKEVQNKQDRVTKQFESAKHDIVFLESDLAKLRGKWTEVNGEQFDENERICSHCGQELQTEKITDAIAGHEKRKSERLKKLEVAAASMKNEITSKEAAIKECLVQLENLTSETTNIKAEIDELNVKANEPIEEISTDTTEIDAQIDVLKNDMDSFKAEDNSAIKEKLSIANKDLQIINVKLSQCDRADADKKAIEDLATELKAKITSMTEVEIEQIAFLDFIAKKISMLEEKVNSKFKTVRFRLFKQNKNGNLEDDCTALINGVPFSGANDAAKVQAGVEIINIICKHYDFNAPIFIDNKESVSELPSTDSQLITMTVDKYYKEASTPTEEMMHREEIADLVMQGEFEKVNKLIEDKKENGGI